MKFLVDSGSVISLVPKSAFNTKQSTKPSDFHLYAANGTIIHTYGTTCLSLHLNLRRAFNWSFIIADVKSAIIGADFLVHHALLLDLKNKQLVDTVTQLTSKGQLADTNIFNVSTINEASFNNDAYASLLNSFIDITLPHTINHSSNQRNNAVCHHIETTGRPVFDRPRRLSGDKLTAAKEDFDLLLRNGVIRPSSSQWASPIHMVQKKLGGWRTTGDFRKLNSCTIPDRYPVPHSNDLIQRLHGSTVFSTIDLVRAYHQIPVADQDVQKTAVATPFGLFEFLGMPPGLRNATQTFQRHMDNLFRGLDFIGCYIDDLIIYSKSHDEHFQHLSTVFEILRANKLTINTQKCHFGQSEVEFLGYTINKDSYFPPPERT